MLNYRLLSLLAVALFPPNSAVHAQQAPAARTQPAVGSNWARVQALPVSTKLHVTTDHGGKNCRVFAVTDDTLTCASGSKPGLVLQRAEIQHIKLTHRVRSTLVGAAIGGGVGAVAGGIGGRKKPWPHRHDLLPERAWHWSGWCRGYFWCGGCGSGQRYRRRN